MSPGPLGPKTPKTLAQSETFLLLWPRSGRCKWQGGRRESTRPSLECRSRISTVQSLLQRPGGTMFDPKLLSKMLSASLLLKQGRRTPQRQPYGATKTQRGSRKSPRRGALGYMTILKFSSERLGLVTLNSGETKTFALSLSLLASTTQ